jgi:hypothetical protein
MPSKIPDEEVDRASPTTTPRAERASRRVQVAALLLIAGLLAGPVGTHV